MNHEIVIVDDEEINLEILADMFAGFQELSSYVIKTFDDPVQAYNYCSQNFLVDTILIDQYMPELSGFEFIDRYLTEIPGEAQASIIMISSDDSSETISQALDRGIDDYFPKPFDTNIMRSRLRSSLERNHLRREIEEAKKLKEILLRVLIHDISNPLTVAKFYCEKINSDYESEHYPKVKRALEAAQEIITSIREIEASELHKTTIEMNDIAVVPMLKSIVELVQPKLEEKGLECKIRSELEGDACIRTDKNILKYQIFLNLLTNSIKFSESNSTIDLYVKKDKGSIVVGIRDYGIGIPDDILENLFRWDYKTNRVGTNGESGTGFGMPIVKRFVDQLGHSIEVASWTDESTGDPSGTDISVTF